MPAARSDLVNAVELAGRAATLERSLVRDQLPRLLEAGALEGTWADAKLAFGRFEGRPTIELRVEGSVMLQCQRCLRPCAGPVSETALLMVVADEMDEVPGGYDPVVGDAERLSVTDVIEEQLLLGIPMVPLHEDESDCGGTAAADGTVEPGSAVEDTQRPFANLRDLLDKGER